MMKGQAGLCGSGGRAGDRPRPAQRARFLLMRGSIMPRIFRVLLFNILLATVVTVMARCSISRSR
jgi:predicted membrane chloride channel (bestrophin family)